MMTFDEWFDNEYPEPMLGSTIIRLSFQEVAQKAWQAALDQSDIRNDYWQAFINRMEMDEEYD